jgi:uncharacterized DUF497 family protein
VDLLREDTRKAYPERRFVGYNSIDGRLMMVVFCCPSPMRTHIISFRNDGAGGGAGAGVVGRSQ